MYMAVCGGRGSGLDTGSNRRSSNGFRKATQKQDDSPTRHTISGADPTLTPLCVLLVVVCKPFFRWPSLAQRRTPDVLSAFTHIPPPTHTYITQAQHGGHESVEEEDGSSHRPSHRTAHSVSHMLGRSAGASLHGAGRLGHVLPRAPQPNLSCPPGCSQEMGLLRGQTRQVDKVEAGTFVMPGSRASFPPSHLPLSCLYFLRHMGPELIEQQRYLPPFDGMEKAQCRARQETGAGGTQQEVRIAISPERNCAVAWIWNRTLFYVLDPTVAHAAISLLDRALCFPMPVMKIKLLGACCLMVESYRGPEPSRLPLTLSEVQSLMGT